MRYKRALHPTGVESAGGSPDVCHVHVADVDPLVGHHRQEQAAGAPVDVVARQYVLPRLHQPHRCHKRRHAAGEDEGAAGTLHTWPPCQPLHREMHKAAGSRFQGTSITDTHPNVLLGL